ncbi:MAG: methyl-accepting chemotaxis protein [Bacillota bacterium]|nr:methyl-accepting chemotaxis protein [Bacillota bacterium]
MNILRNITSIRKKMLLVFIPLIIFAILSITGIILFYAEKNVVDLEKASANEEINSMKNSMEQEFKAHQRLAEALAAIGTVQGNNNSREQYISMTKEILSKSSNAYGMGIWFEPYAYDKSKKYFGPYIHRDEDKLVYTDEFENESYDYLNTDWYKAGKESKKGVIFTKPYYNATLGITIITAVMPFYQNGQFMGVVTADYNLTTIQKIVTDSKFLNTGYALLVDNQGKFISNPNRKKVMRDTLKNDADFKSIAPNEMNKTQGELSFSNAKGVKYELVYNTLPTTEWKIMIVAPDKEFFASMYNLLYKAVFLTLLILLLSFALIYLFSGLLTRNISKIVKGIKYLAKGDLTRPIEVTGKDELSKMAIYYNEALQKLKEMINRINISAESLSASAEELSASTEETCRSITEVASSIQTVAINSNEQNGHVEKMNDSTIDMHNQMGSISENIEVVKDSALRSSKLAHEGEKYVNDAISQMNEINTQVVESSATINNLSEKSKKIEEILSMITSIATKTNLLALNAAIEAARAGEQGKGFAVVADEVRKLAEASGKASADIRLLIQEIQDGINRSVEVMTTSTKSTEQGIQIVEQTGKAFKNISSAIDDVSERTEDVYESIISILEEAKQMREIVAAVNEIAISNSGNAQSVIGSTQEQTAIVEQVSAATQELANMSEGLQKEISRFVV